MTQTAEFLAKLPVLVRDTTPEGRRALLAGLTDLFVAQAARTNAGVRAAFGALMADLAFALDTDARRELVERLARLDTAPFDLMRRLANDDIDVAAPVLWYSPVLDDATLIEIAAEHGNGYAAAIAMRETLSDDLWIGLVPLAKGNKALQSALIERLDMPPAVAAELFWHVCPKFGLHALALAADANGRSAPGNVFDALTPVDDTPLAPQAIAFADRKEARDELGEALLVRLLRDGDTELFFACFCRFTSYDLRLVRRLAADTSGMGYAVISKAAGLDRSTFSTFALMCANGRRKPDDTFALMTFFERLDPQVAMRAIEVWERRVAGVQPQAPRALRAV